MSHSYRVWGRYKSNNLGWESNELFVKEGEVRFIENKLFRLFHSDLTNRIWVEIPADYDVIHACIDARLKNRREAEKR